MVNRGRVGERREPEQTCMPGRVRRVHRQPTFVQDFHAAACLERNFRELSSIERVIVTLRFPPVWHLFESVGMQQ